jgi:hypothetical protein
MIRSGGCRSSITPGCAIDAHDGVGSRPHFDAIAQKEEAVRAGCRIPAPHGKRKESSSGIQDFDHRAVTVATLEDQDLFARGQIGSCAI